MDVHVTTWFCDDVFKYRGVQLIECHIRHHFGSNSDHAVWSPIARACEILGALWVYGWCCAACSNLSVFHLEICWTTDKTLSVCFLQRVHFFLSRLVLVSSAWIHFRSQFCNFSVCVTFKLACTLHYRDAEICISSVIVCWLNGWKLNSLCPLLDKLRLQEMRPIKTLPTTQCWESWPNELVDRMKRMLIPENYKSQFQATKFWCWYHRRVN